MHDRNTKFRRKRPIHCLYDHRPTKSQCALAQSDYVGISLLARNTTYKRWLDCGWVKYASVKEITYCGTCISSSKTLFSSPGSGMKK